MTPETYGQFGDLDLLALCIWREGRGEGMMGKRGIAHVIANRVNARSFFGHNIQTVILKPFAFSSFNADDPNSDKWPSDVDTSWQDSQAAAKQVLSWQD